MEKTSRLWKSFSNFHFQQGECPGQSKQRMLQPKDFVWETRYIGDVHKTKRWNWYCLCKWKTRFWKVWLSFAAPTRETQSWLQTCHYSQESKPLFWMWQPLHKDSNADYLRKWKNFSGSDTFKFQPQDVPASNFFSRKKNKKKRKKKKKRRGRCPLSEKLSCAARVF